MCVVIQFTLQRYDNFLIFAIAGIVKSSTIFKTGTPKRAVSVFHDVLFLRLTLKIGYCSAILSLQAEGMVFSLRCKLRRL